MIQYGMPTLIENRTLQENIDLCIRLGLRFIELNMNFPEYQVDRLEKTDLFLDAAEAAGIYYTIHLDENLNIADFNRLVTDAYLETVRRTIEVAKQLLPLRDKYGDVSQPLTINMHMHHGIFITLPDRKVQMYDRDKDRYLEDCRRFRDLCGSWIGDAPVLIAVENTDGFRGYEQDRLVHFHIHDGTEQPPRNHLALGDGEIDLADRLALAESRHCRCVLETKTIEALTRSVGWLADR